MAHAVADVEEPGRCETCGRELPPQQGRGRRRRYCDATCRSAARRDRARGRGAAQLGRQDVKAALTVAERHVSLDTMQGAADPVASTVRVSAGRLADELDRPGAGSPL